MNAAEIAVWIGLFAQAEQIGVQVLADVKAVAHKNLTPEENAAVLAVWDDNVRRAAANAGITDPA